MGKARTDRYGNTKEQKLINENRKLKQAVSQLRKQLARIDLDRYDTVKEMIKEHYQEEKAEQGQKILENLKQAWRCNDCSQGHLEIFVYNRGDTTYYYRICSEAPSCVNRTKSKPYTPNVKGIIRKGK